MSNACASLKYVGLQSSDHENTAPGRLQIYWELLDSWFPLSTAIKLTELPAVNGVLFCIPMEHERCGITVVVPVRYTVLVLFIICWWIAQ